MTMLIRQRAADRCFHERSCFVWHPAITGSLFRKDPSVGLEGMLPENQVNIFIFCYSCRFGKCLENGTQKLSYQGLRLIGRLVFKFIYHIYN